jgi:hypothetical protein
VTVAFTPFCKSWIENGLRVRLREPRNETTISTEQIEAKAAARLSRAHGDEGRP